MTNIQKLVGAYTAREPSIVLTFPGGESLTFRTLKGYGDIQRMKNGMVNFAKGLPLRGTPGSESHLHARVPLALIAPDPGEADEVLAFLQETAPEDLTDTADGWVVNVLPKTVEDAGAAYILHHLSMEPTKFSQVQALYACRAGWLIDSILQWWDANKLAIVSSGLDEQVAQAGEA